MQEVAPRRAEHWLTFAFAAADLLAEAGPDQRIIWASGAYRARFGRDAQDFVGRPFADLVTPSDHPALIAGLMQAASQGRLPPIMLRLSNDARTACSVSAMRLAGPQARLCISIGPVATVPHLPRSEINDANQFGAASESWIRAGSGGMLGLVQLPSDTMAIAEIRKQVLQAAEQACGPGTLVGEIGRGRFGVLSQQPVDACVLTQALQRLLPPDDGRMVQAEAISLAPSALTGAQAVRALRYAVTQFSRDGIESVRIAGFGAGLAGFVDRVAMQADVLQSVIRRRQFRMLFQPVVSLTNRKVAHYEALLRPRPLTDFPGLTTQDFVTMAEAVGLSEELDAAVLDVSLQALAANRTAQIAVNVSGLSAQSAAFRENLRDRRDIPPDRLLIELTETADIEDVDAAAGALQELRARGVRICIDDFGAGSAAFRYLRNFPIDLVKIDGAYVRSAATDPRDRGIVASMIEAARAVQADVIAEMIETEEQATTMRELGVTLGQGWLFGKPGNLAIASRLTPVA